MLVNNSAMNESRVCVCVSVCLVCSVRHVWMRETRRKSYYNSDMHSLVCGLSRFGRGDEPKPMSALTLHISFLFMFHLSHVCVAFHLLLVDSFSICPYWQSGVGTYEYLLQP